jgi:2-polyprenyl-6-methoxyphenol hydroxylase-like FAD-dependent oxidoreductase
MSVDPGSPLRIAILGGGTAGWMAASLMARRWAGRAVEISVLESPEIGIVGVGEGSTPQLKGFFDTLGIEEREWMPRCNATFKTAIQSRGWSTRPGFADYYHPFKTDLDDRSAPAYYFNTLMRRRGADVPAHPDGFFIDTALARRRLAPHPAHAFPFRAFYGYHFDAYLIGAFLREWACARGVRHLEGTASRIEQAEDGAIRALHLDDGRELRADFFLDCSGFRSALLQQALGVPFLPFAANLFNDAAVALPTPHAERPIAPQTTATALRCGWAWRIPLVNRVGNGYVYSTRYLDPEDAERELRAHLGAGDEIPARHLRMRVGRVAEPWSRNCLAVGLSQGFIEPLEATALHLVQETLERFIEAFTAGGFGDSHREAFNREINGRFEGIRDYIVCRYKANTRSDTAYWRDAAAITELSDSLRGLLACWHAGGDLVAEIERQGIGIYFGVLSWHCLLGGYGLYPDAVRPPTDRERPFDVARIADFIERCTLNFRDHDRVLAELAGTP